MPKLTVEMEVIAAHMAATTAAFQVLVRRLQESGTLERGEFPEMLRIDAGGVEDCASPAMLTLLDDLRKSLMD